MIQNHVLMNKIKFNSKPRISDTKKSRIVEHEIRYKRTSPLMMTFDTKRLLAGSPNVRRFAGHMCYHLLPTTGKLLKQTGNFFR